jgi:hypothetical protein
MIAAISHGDPKSSRFVSYNSHLLGRDTMGACASENGFNVRRRQDKSCLRLTEECTATGHTFWRLEADVGPERFVGDLRCNTSATATAKPPSATVVRRRNVASLDRLEHRFDRTHSRPCRSHSGGRPATTP